MHQLESWIVTKCQWQINDTKVKSKEQTKCRAMRREIIRNEGMKKRMNVISSII